MNQHQLIGLGGPVNDFAMNGFSDAFRTYIISRWTHSSFVSIHGCTTQ